jgi:hypothetical protein
MRKTAVDWEAQRVRADAKSRAIPRYGTLICDKAKEARGYREPLACGIELMQDGHEI